MKIDLIKRKSVALPPVFVNRVDFIPLTQFLCRIGPNKPDLKMRVNKLQLIVWKRSVISLRLYQGNANWRSSEIQ